MALSQRRIEEIWVQQGGDPKYAPLMARIALRESGGRPRINNRGLNKNGTTDWGLFQVNDIWRKDPVVGPLFRSGKILTPEGATKAAIHILKVQGPQAWATYNSKTDQQYLGGFKGGPKVPAPKVTTRTIPGVDRSQERKQVLWNYLQTSRQPGSLTSLAAGLDETRSTPARTVKVSSPTVASSAPAAASPSDHRIGTFEGARVAAWMVPALKWARAHGWKGQVNSGVRTTAEQAVLYQRYKAGGNIAAKPGQSNHEIQNGGAVDVSDPRTLANLMKRYPGKRLIWAPTVGLNDSVHFSSNGH